MPILLQIKKSLTQFPWQKQYSFPVLIIALLMTLLVCLPILWQQQLDYFANQIINGEVWRLISGHFVHANLNHYGLNLAGLFALWALHGQYYSFKRLGLICLISSLTISTALLIQGDLMHYVGLSGVLHGLFVYGVIEDFYRKDKTAGLLLIGLVIKLVHEQVYGGSNEVAQLIGVTVAIDAHLFGAMSGLLAAVIIKYYKIN